MDRTEADTLVAETLEDLWQSGHQPVLGAKLKLEVLRRSRATGRDFDEREFGHLSFASFLETVPGIAVRRRPGTDFVVVPESHADTVVAFSPPTRVRPDFWRAIVGFPVGGEIRAYSPSEDRVLSTREGETLPADAVPIPPIPKDRQLQWRIDFIRSLGPGSGVAELADDLTLDGGFARFARALDAHPELRASWNAAWLSHVTGEIRDWGQRHRIEDSVWLVTSLPPRVGREDEHLRRDLLDLIGRVPTEHLEKIEVKLGWLIRRSGRR